MHLIAHLGKVNTNLSTYKVNIWSMEKSLYDFYSLVDKYRKTHSS